MASAETVHVEVVYARPDVQSLVSLRLAAGVSVRKAIEKSGLLEKFPEIDITRNKMGIFGKPVPPDMPLREGDRVEIYRMLLKDPKEARRERARQGHGTKTTTQAG
ncbi:MAG: RnfH family protein [Gammaproteobacteria bacterium]